MAKAHHVRFPKSLQLSDPPNFDRVARVYRWAEYLCLGPLLERTREHFVEAIGSARSVLALGDGDGRFLARLLKEGPQVRVLAVDASARMLALLRDRCHFASDRVRTLQTDFVSPCSCEELRAFDVIVSHFSLDCLTPEQLQRLVQWVSACALPGTLWLISDFAQPRHQPWRSLGKAYVTALYAAFGFLTGLRVQQLPRIQEVLSHAGFQCVAHHERLHGLLFSEIWRVPLAHSEEGSVFRAT